MADDPTPAQRLQTARRRADEKHPSWCPACEHVHADPSLGRICVGCPCTERPGPAALPQPVPLDGRELLRAVREALQDDTDLRASWVGIGQRLDLEVVAERLTRRLEDRLAYDDPLRRHLRRWDDHDEW